MGPRCKAITVIGLFFSPPYSSTLFNYPLYLPLEDHSFEVPDTAKESEDAMEYLKRVQKAEELPSTVPFLF
ncbi:hypothetical protein BU17DRAFT_89610 [Hysterangium stoloniferum]|nr:hypothetical protein BU17DRAFT_89610 [Hysterangium stoloniferum]